MVLLCFTVLRSFTSECIFISVKLCKNCSLPVQFLVRAEKQQLYKELKRCLDVVEPIDGKSSDEVVVSMPYLLSKYRIMSLSMIRCLLEYFLGGKGEIGEHKFKKNTVVSVFFRVLIR